MSSAIVRRVRQLEKAVRQNQSLPSYKGEWKPGDLIILLSVINKVLREYLESHVVDAMVRDVMLISEA